MSKLKIVVLYDRMLVDEGEESTGSDKAPVTRTLDKKEVEEEVAEAIVKLGHEPVMHELDGTHKSLFGLAKVECDLVFNLVESFAGDDTADFKIAAFLELVGKKYTGAGTNGLLLAQDKAVAKKIFAFHGIHTPTFRKVLSRSAGFLARPAVSGHREARSRGRLHRHRVQRRGQLHP